MNQYIKMAGAVIGFVLLIAISIAAYHKLTKDYDTNQLQEQTEDTGTATGESEEKKEDTAKETEEAEETAKAPDFTVVNENDEDVLLSELTGKPIVLNFWASWCSPCKSEMPTFQKIYEIYGDEVEFVIVNLTDDSRETKDSAMDFISKNRYTFPVYFDVNQSAAYAYSVSSIPTTYFIDSDGKVAAYSQGALDEETLIKGINMIDKDN